MNCNHNERYALGDLSEQEYQQHAAQCEVCRALEKVDAELMDLCAEMKEEPSPPLAIS